MSDALDDAHNQARLLQLEAPKRWRERNEQAIADMNRMMQRHQNALQAMPGPGMIPNPAFFQYANPQYGSPAPGGNFGFIGAAPPGQYDAMQPGTAYGETSYNASHIPGRRPKDGPSFWPILLFAAFWGAVWWYRKKMPRKTASPGNSAPLAKDLPQEGLGCKVLRHVESACRLFSRICAKHILPAMRNGLTIVWLFTKKAFHAVRAGIASIRLGRYKRSLGNAIKILGSKMCSLGERVSAQEQHDLADRCPPSVDASLQDQDPLAEKR